MSKSKSLLKNTMILGIGQFVPKIVALITLPIFTACLSTSGYGTYDLIVSFSSLFLPLLTLLIQQAVFRFIISEKDKNNYYIYITNSLFFIFISSIFWFIVLLVGLIFFKFSFTFVILIFLFYFIQSINDVVGQIARGFGKNNLFSLGIILFSISNLFLTLIFLYNKMLNLNTIIIILTISYFISFIFVFLKLKVFKYINLKEISFKQIKTMLKYSIPIIPSSISLWIVNLSDRILISKFLGLSMNGIYAVANKIPNLFGTAYSIFNLAWTELASRSIDEENIDEYYSDLFNSLFTFLIGAIMALITLSPIMFEILIDSKYNEGFFQMPVLFFGVFFSCLVSFYGGLYVALSKTKKVGLSSLFGAILNFLINILLIKKIGLYAASVSTLVSFFVIFIYRCIDLKKYINIKYNFKKIYIGILFSVISLILFYVNNIISLLLGILAALVYNLIFNDMFKKIITLVFKKIKSKI